MICPPKTFFPAIIAAALAMPGCNRERITVYAAPKDVPKAPADAAADPHAGHDHAATDDPHAPAGAKGPQVAWKIPAGWKETAPSSVNFASFIIEGGEGEATVNISQLPNLRGREALVVNMWREQVAQSPLSDEEAAKALVPTTVAGQDGLSFEVAGTNSGGPVRIVTAVLHRPEASWFFKLAGADAKVSAHKLEFFEFVKDSVRFVEGESPDPAAGGPVASQEIPPPNEPQPSLETASNIPPPPPAPEPENFQWTVPADWAQLAPGQMQVAKFDVPEKDGAKAQVAVSIFPSDTGGIVENVKRWRRQIGLGEADDAEIMSHVTDLDAAALPGASVVEISNEQKQILGAIVPRDGRWWFYKMSGEAPAVSAARDSFIAFAKSTP